MKRKVLLFGGSGMLGNKIFELFSSDFSVISPTHQQVDITNTKQIRNNIQNVRPDVIIYSVGLTSVDKAEDNPTLAFSLNADAPLKIAQIAKKLNVPVFYISTDAVFDAKKCRKPHFESESPKAKSVYGLSKLQGEKNVLETSDKNCVVRVVMLYSSNFLKRKDFIRIVIDDLSSDKEISAITDQIVSPLLVDTLAKALKVLVVNNASGIYHLGPTDYLTNYNLARLVADKFKLSKDLIKPVGFNKFYKERKRNRSKTIWLDVSKFEKEFKTEILNPINKDLEVFQKITKSKSS